MENFATRSNFAPPSPPPKSPSRSALLAEIRSRSAARRKLGTETSRSIVVATAVREALEREVARLRSVVNASDFASSSSGRAAAVAVARCERACESARARRERARLNAEDAAVSWTRAAAHFRALPEQRWEYNSVAEGSAGAHAVFAGTKLTPDGARWTPLHDAATVALLNAACDDTQSRRSDWVILNFELLPPGWVYEAGSLPWLPPAQPAWLFEAPLRAAREAGSAAWTAWLAERMSGGAKAGADFSLHAPPGTRKVAAVAEVKGMTLEICGKRHALRCCDAAACTGAAACSLSSLSAGDACRAPSGEGARGCGVALRKAHVVKAPRASAWALVRWADDARGRCKRVPRASLVHAAPAPRWRRAHSAHDTTLVLERAHEDAARAISLASAAVDALVAQRARAADEAKAFAIASAAEMATSCCVCRDAPPEFAMLPCGHRCCCAGCAEALRQRGQRKCPVCRAFVEGTCHIFL